MTGTYSSFQQAWQERAPLDVHRVETDTPHAALEIELTTRADGHLDVRIVQDRQLELAPEVWIAHGGRLFRPLDSMFAQVEVTDGGLAALITAGPLANPLPYRLRKARSFRGWVEVPDDGPYDPAVGSDTAYRRTSDLGLHDQGGLVETADASGQPLTVELVQLVYGKALPILKLAVYDVPAAEVTTDSHAVAYTWSEPGASRLGLNLRDVVTGWTLDADGLANSDDAAVPRSSEGQ